MTTPGQFSPIEDVIREAEERAEYEWRIEHEPCQHGTWIDNTAIDHPYRSYMCAACGTEKREPR